MSQSADFYSSWLGSSAFGGAGVRIRDQEPIIFQPTDISGLALWMDGNDNDTVTYNELLLVSAWKNKGYLGGQFDLSGGVIEYGQVLVNSLNTVTFRENSFMTATYSLNFQGRSVFFVTKENTNLGDGIPNPWIASDTIGGMETFSLRNAGTFTYFLGKHPSPIPELAFDTTTDYLGVPTLVEFINSSNAPDNWIGINGTKYPSTYDAAAAGYNTGSILYYLGGYFGGTAIPSNQDICEVLVYNTALNDPDRQNVEKYLRKKWNLAEPPPPPPEPFSPKDIAGLNIWFDATEASSIVIDGMSNIASWSNLGSAGGEAVQNNGYARVIQDVGGKDNVQFLGSDLLMSNVALPYYSRTQFVVFKSITDMQYASYPYLNFITGQDGGAMGSGVNWESGTGDFQYSLCQNGISCPVQGSVPTNPLSNATLVMFLLDSTDSIYSILSVNNGSNINIAGGGDEFLQTSTSFLLNNAAGGIGQGQNLCEIIEYNSVLSSSNVSTVTAYLSQKWSLGL